jgi:O-antigen ligase
LLYGLVTCDRLFEEQKTCMSDKLEKSIRIGLSIAILVSSLTHGAVEAWSVALLELLLLSLVLLWGIKGFLDKNVTLFVPQSALPFAILIVLGIFQSLSITSEAGSVQSLSMDVEATRNTVLVLTVLFAAFLLAGNFLRERRDMQSLVQFLIIFGSILALFALLQHFTWNGSIYWFRQASPNREVFGPFANHAHFAGYMEMLIPLPVALMIKERLRPEWKLFYAFAAAIMGMAVITSLSRGGMIGLAAGMLFMMVTGVLLPKKQDSSPFSGFSSFNSVKVVAARTGMIASIVCLIILGVIWIGSEPVLDRLSKASVIEGDAKTKTVFSGRTEIWKNTLSMIEANPVLGVGLGAYETAYPIYSTRSDSLIVAQSHNDYLQIVSDCGIVGGCIALWFLIVISQAVWRSCRHRILYLQVSRSAVAQELFLY